MCKLQAGSGNGICGLWIRCNCWWRWSKETTRTYFKGLSQSVLPGELQDMCGYLLLNLQELYRWLSINSLKLVKIFLQKADYSYALVFTGCFSIPKKRKGTPIDVENPPYVGHGIPINESFLGEYNWNFIPCSALIFCFSKITGCLSFVSSRLFKIQETKCRSYWWRRGKTNYGFVHL